MLSLNEYQTRVSQLRKLADATEVLLADDTETGVVMLRAGVQLKAVAMEAAATLAADLASTVRHAEKAASETEVTLAKYHVDSVYAAIGRFLTARDCPNSEGGIKYLYALGYELGKIHASLTEVARTAEAEAEAASVSAYNEALASGLSDVEAREDGWPEAQAQPSNVTSIHDARD